jgi:hypothetical protein
MGRSEAKSQHFATPNSDAGFSLRFNPAYIR